MKLAFVESVTNLREAILSQSAANLLCTLPGIAVGGEQTRPEKYNVLLLFTTTGYYNW